MSRRVFKRGKPGGRLAAFLAMALCLTLAGPPAMASGSDGTVPIDGKHFPDEAFRALVSEEYDADGDGSLSADEIAGATELNCFGTDIADLRGVEYLTELVALQCSLHEELTALDISGNTKLKSLSCSYCGLEALDVSGNAALENLSCAGNGLTALDVSGNTALRSLEVSDNLLTTLDISQNPGLTVLICARNQLAALDVGGNAALVTLDCSGNGLEALDISGNAALEWLDCHDNRIAALDIDPAPGLVHVASGERTVTDGVAVYSGDGMRLTVDGDTELSFTAAAVGLPIDREHFPDEIFRAFVQDTLDQNGDGRLSDAEIAEVRSLTLTDFGISDLTGVAYFTELTYLRCDRNRLTALDVSANTALQELYCQDNQLKTLTLGENAALKALDCSLNQLLSVDIRSCPKLLDATRGGKRVQSGIVEYGAELDGTFTAVLTCDAATAVAGDLSARVPGDIDGDGTADARDAARLLRALRNGENLPDTADANGDGKVDVLDIISILLRSVGRAAVQASGSDTGMEASNTDN